MDHGSFVSGVRERLEQLLQRVRIVDAEIDQAMLNQKPDHNHWTLGQIFEHMLISNQGYYDQMKSVLEKGIKGEEAIKHSWFGKVILKGAGPGGNVPAPKPLVPPPGPYDHAVIERWQAQHEGFLGMLDELTGINLSATKVKNAIMPIFSMNLADLFELLVVHGERHVGQIEVIAKQMRRQVG